MSITAATLVTKIGVAGADAAAREVAGFGDKLKDISRGMGVAGAAMTAGLTAPLIGLVAAANSAGTALNRELGNVQSLGVTQARVLELKDAVQDLAIETGTGTEIIAKGLYQVISAFGDTADTERILTINSKAAAAGLATVEEAILLTSAVTKAYNDTSADAVQHAADLAQQTIILGQTTLPDLANGMGRVTAVAQQMGVSQEELFATFATETGVMGSAAEVATNLKGGLQALMNPTDTMTTLFDQLGVVSGKALIEQEGMVGAFRLIINAAEESGTPLQKYIGSIEGQALALSLAGPMADAYAAKLAAMMDVTGVMEGAFDAQTQGVNAAGFAAQQAGVKWEVFLQKINDGLAPAKIAVINALTPMQDKVLAFADMFANLDPDTQMFAVAMAALVAATGPVLLAVAGVIGAIATIGLPMLLVGIGVGLLAAAWATNWNDMQTKTQAAVDAIKGIIAGIGTAFSNTTFPTVADLWADFQAGDFEAIAEKIKTTTFQLLVNLTTELDIKGKVQGLQDTINAQITAASNSLTTLLTAVTGFATALVTGIDAAAIAGAATSLVQGLSSAFVAAINTEKLGELGTAAGTLVNSVVTKLSELFSAPKFGEDIGTAVGKAAGALALGAGALVTGIVNQIADTDWSTFVDSLAGFSQSFIAGVAGGLASADYGPIAKGLFTGIGAALVSLIKANPLSFFNMGPQEPIVLPGKNKDVARPLSEAGLMEGGPSYAEIGSSISDAFKAGMASFAWPELTMPTWLTTWQWPSQPEWMRGWKWPEWTMPPWLGTLLAFLGGGSAGAAGVNVLSAFANNQPVAEPPYALGGAPWREPSPLLGPSSGWPGTELTFGAGAGGAATGAAAVPMLVWADYVEPLVWLDYVTAIVWEDIIPSFKWLNYVYVLNWANYVMDISWGEFIRDMKWSSYVSDLSWGQFVPTLNWGAFIPSMAGGGGSSGDSAGAAPGSGAPGDPLLATPVAPSPWDPPASAAGVTVQITGPVSISNMGDIESVADQIISAMRRRM